MDKKIISIVVMILLIASVCIPLVNSISVYNKNNSVSVSDDGCGGCGLQLHYVSVLQDLNNNGVCEVDEWLPPLFLYTYTGSLTCADNYDYHLSDACAHPVNAPTPEERQSRWYFYHGSDGLSLGMIHDKKDSNFGGSVDLTIDVTQGFPFQEDANVCVSDDPSPPESSIELYETTSNHFIGDWTYKECCTDGGVIYNLTCDAMRIDVDPKNWGTIQKWRIYGLDLNQNEIFIDLDLSRKTSFLCGWDNCIDIEKTVKGPLDTQYRDTTTIFLPCEGEEVVFKISICVCEWTPDGIYRSIGIPYESIEITDVLPSNIDFDSSIPAPSSSDPSSGTYVWNLGQIEGTGFLATGDCYDICIYATVLDATYKKINLAKVVSSCPPGCSTSVLKEDTATVYCSDRDLPPDIGDDEKITLANIKPGETVSSNFQIMNIGETGSRLNWEIIEWPNWGTWTFEPSSGTDLKPEDGPLTIDVEVQAPDEKNKEFTGEIKVVNTDDPSDYCTITFSLTTPKNKQDLGIPFLRFIHDYPILFRILQVFQQF